MTAKELQDIHSRYFKYSPPPNHPGTREFNNSLAKNPRKAFKMGTLIWNKGTFKGNLRCTFKLGN